MNPNNSRPAPRAPLVRLRARTSPRPPAGYPVVVGAGALSELRHLLPETGHGLAIVSDERVWSLWGEPLLAALGELAPPPARYLVPPGERSKSREMKASLEDALLEDGWGRDLVLLALGGGVVTDLTGFLAATYLRGVRYLSVPTTLLAMVDAALGGKTGVNTPAGKNLVGAFCQPEAVLAPLETLETLPEVELENGLAETVKHAAIADEELLCHLVQNAAAFRARDVDVLGETVARSAAVKLRLVEGDELDNGVRQALNFGHTVGHGLELATSFGMRHGHAVCVGMVVEAEAAVKAGLAPPEVRDGVLEALLALGLPTRVPAGLDVSLVMASVALDKKNRGGQVRYCFPRRLGQVPSFGEEHTTPLPEEAVLAALESRA